MSTHPSFNPDLLSKTAYESLNSVPSKGILQGKRRLTKGLSGKRIVFFPSKKNEALMPCESRLEADNCLDLEFDTSVTSYRTQPFTIDLGGKQSYTPDSIHIDKLGKLVVREVKFSGALEKGDLLIRLEKISNIFSRLEICFQTLTEKNLQLPTKNKNYKFLYRCSHQKYDEMQISYALGIFNNLPTPCTLKDFRQCCNKSHLPPLLADSLLFLGLISFNENMELTPDSHIWIVGGES